MATRHVVMMFCGLFLAARPLHAEPVTLQLFGSLNFVSSDIAHAMSIGDGFEFTLSYDTDAPFSQFGSLRDYETGALSWSLAGYSGGAPILGGQGPQSSLVSDSRFHVELDSWFTSVLHPASTVLPGDWGLRALYVFYNDAATFPGQLPTAVHPGASMAFSAYYSRLDASGRVGDSAALSATGVATSIHRVPEPSTSLLMGAGGLILAGWRTVRRRRVSS
jgi:hypothetical protein